MTNTTRRIGTIQMKTMRCTHDLPPSPVPSSPVPHARARCAVHVQQGAEMSLTFYCTMANNMIYLHYGKGRRTYANDGRGIRPTLEVAWVSNDTPSTWRERLLLCPTDYVTRGVYLSNRELVSSATRGCLEQDQESHWGENSIVLSAAPSVLPVSLHPVSNTPLDDATCCNYHTPQQERQVCCGVIL